MFKQFYSVFLILFVVVAGLNGSLALAAEVPELICQTVDEVVVNHAESLPTTRHEPSTQTLYRFSNNVLYLSAPDHNEYEYGDIESPAFLRFVVGYKVINFTNDSFTTAYDVHSDWTGTTIRRLKCIRPK